MAAFALLDVDLFADELDLSCFANQATVNIEANELDATTFCSGGWVTPIAGGRTTEVSASGPTDMATATAAQTSAVDEILAVDLGANYVLSAVPAGGVEGSVAYFTTGILLNRQVLDGSAGDLATHSVMWRGNQRMARGTLTSLATVTATGNGTGFQLGAVSASQRMCAAVHFLTAGGTTPSITVIIESDDNAGFTTPTTRITFTAATAKGAQYSSVLGAITDDYWRARWTVSGTSPSFQTRVMLGISA
jgi:hypothetical protein